jgi:hypothetical protein
MVTLALLFRPSTTPAGKQFLRPEIVQDEFAALAQGAGNLLHGLNSGAHDLAAPLVEEPSGPGDGVVIP